MKFYREKKNFPMLALEYENYSSVRLSINNELDINLTPFIILRESFSLMKLKKLYQQSSPFLDSAAKRFWSSEHRFHFHMLRISRELCTMRGAVILCNDIPQSHRLARIIDRTSFLILCGKAGSWPHTLQFCRTFISGMSGVAAGGSEGIFLPISSRKALLVGLVAAIATDRVDDFFLAPFIQTELPSLQNYDSFSSAVELLDLLLQPCEAVPVQLLVTDLEEEVLRSSIETEGGGFFFSHMSRDWKELSGLLLGTPRVTTEQLPCGWRSGLLSDWDATRQYSIFNRLLASSCSTAGQDLSNSNSSNRGSSILIVGDGDFSFSSALAGYMGAQDTAVEQPTIVSSSLDSEALLIKKYPQYLQNIQRLNSIGGLLSVSVLYGLDATQLGNSSLPHGQRFDSIVFNFPYADTEPAVAQVRDRLRKRGQPEARPDEWDTFWVAKGRHVHLLGQFLRSCKSVLRSRDRSMNDSSDSSSNSKSAVYVSLLLSQVVSWDIEETARQQGYHLRCMYPFNTSYFAGWG